MIKKDLWIWKGVPENLVELKEVLVLWFGSALVLGILIAMAITTIVKGWFS